ncbi:UPF0489 domain-containing protein [Desulfonispora thiosulfatigenes DSM 11270]|uniref:UPF0489 domain-containing protein n=1 Tax=Desulfonispora thiosulfatigenes DSM 11270 TaxID=656914 RepID=A0A1W1UHW7_DESTI|nr:UPF0489 family protein [Desulfonispora thiosulfatigenes]SMB80705.1 UPF0489 domain-containing protein [Desulfonispora thiosulfatigenes DSM 11270]
MKANNVIAKVVGGKKTYIVENHHEVIISWSEYASNNETAPVLLTFDHHIDTRSAFYRYSRKVAGLEWRPVRDQLIANVDINDSNSIEAALKRLCNDEHIDFALQTGIISDAIVFSLMDVGICRDFANNKICYIDPYCTSKYNKNSHGDECQIDVYDKVIEGEELFFKLKQINQFIPGFFISDRINKKFILDIDLDCFHTKKAINPVDMSVFNYLVNNAEIITIAKEGYYVDLEKKDNDINENYLLEKLLAHIENSIERTEGNKRFKSSRYNSTRKSDKVS